MRSPIKLGLAAAAGLLLALFAVLQARAASATPPAYRVVPAECMVSLPPDLQIGKDVFCGYLTVPELYSDPGGETIELAVMVLKASNPAAPDPLVMAQGGPGGGTIDFYFSQLLDHPLDAGRDIILFDQRGTGFSRPALDCPEINAAVYDSIDKNLGMEALNQVYNNGAAACRQNLEMQGVNLAAFNSLENARDVDALRQALGYEQINLYGVSYGTLLALHTLRDHPEGLRSVILDAVLPPQMNLNASVPRAADYAFTRLFEACAADSDCGEAYPDLETRFFDLVERLNQHPVNLDLVDMEWGQAYRDVFTGDDLLWGVFQMMYAKEIIPLLPELIRNAEAGDFEALQAIQSLLVFDRSVKLGMYWSVYCTEDGDFDPAALDFSGIRPQIAKDQVASLEGTRQLCQLWGAPDLGPEADAPAVSELPVLILSGQFDPITPEPNAVETARTLSHSTLVTFPGNGHGALFSSDCADRIVLDFIADPQAPVDMSCVEKLPPVDFLTPDEYVPVSLWQAYVGVLQFKPVTLAIFAVYILIIMALLSGPPVYLLAWLVHRLCHDVSLKLPPRLRLAARFSIMEIVLSVLFLGILAWKVGDMLFSNDVLALLGLPSSAWYLLVLPPWIGVFALVGLLASVGSLVGEKEHTFLRLYQFLLSAAGIVFTGLLAFSGMLTAWLAWLR